MTGFKDHFSGHAALYADCRPTYPAALAEALAEISPARELALDCGCGSGQLSVLLAEQFERVKRPTRARRRSGRRPHTQGDLRVAPAEASGLDDQAAILWSRRRRRTGSTCHATGREVARVLKPGGSGGTGRLRAAASRPALDAVIVPSTPMGWGGSGRPSGGLSTAATRHRLPFPEVAAPQIDMTAEWNRAQFLGYIATWSAVKAAEKQGLDPLAAFTESVTALWPNESQFRTVRWPLCCGSGTPSKDEKVIGNTFEEYKVVKPVE